MSQPIRGIPDYLSGNTSIRRAAEATTTIDPPAVTYIQPGTLTDTGKGIVAVAKQGNTIVQLLTQIIENQNKILAALADLKQKDDDISALSKQFSNLTVSKEAKGKLKVIRGQDPYEQLKKLLDDQKL